MATAGIERRVDIQIPSVSDDLMSGWLYPSPHFTATNPGPAIVIAHGLGGTKEMRLDVFADKFNLLGYTCVVFDYRHFGGSQSLPKGLIDFAKQQEDWKSAIKYTRQLENVDPDQIGLFGTSFSGGHVIQLAAGDNKIKAVISQCPFTDGWKSALCLGITAIPKASALGLMDFLFGSTNIPLLGKPGEAALLNSPDSLPGYEALAPPGYEAQKQVPARVALKIPLLYPGSYASEVKCPVLFGICGKDSVAPADTTFNYAKKAPKGVVKWYEDMGHFDIYVGDAHEKAMGDYVEFLKTNLPI